MEDRAFNGIKYTWHANSLPAPLSDQHWNGGPLGGKIELAPAKGTDRPYIATGVGQYNRHCETFEDAAVAIQRVMRAEFDRQYRFAMAYRAAAEMHGGAVAASVRDSVTQIQSDLIVAFT